jgi:hypothetical protein
MRSALEAAARDVVERLSVPQGELVAEILGTTSRASRALAARRLTANSQRLAAALRSLYALQEESAVAGAEGRADAGAPNPRWARLANKLDAQVKALGPAIRYSRDEAMKAAARELAPFTSEGRAKMRERLGALDAKREAETRRRVEAGKKWQAERDARRARRAAARARAAREEESAPRIRLGPDYWRRRHREVSCSASQPYLCGESSCCSAPMCCGGVCFEGATSCPWGSPRTEARSAP